MSEIQFSDASYQLPVKDTYADGGCRGRQGCHDAATFFPQMMAVAAVAVGGTVPPPCQRIIVENVAHGNRSTLPTA